MSQYGSKRITKQQESRISTLEKRQAHRQADAENAAPMKSPIRLEGPGDVLTLFEEAVSLVRNATNSQDVAKGRALAYIASKGVGILPLLEQEQLQEEDWETTRKGQETLLDLAARDPRVGEAIDTLIKCVFEGSTRTGEQLTARELKDWKAELDARQG
jgi:hypothetical protein